MWSVTLFSHRNKRKCLDPGALVGYTNMAAAPLFRNTLTWSLWHHMKTLYSHGLECSGNMITGSIYTGNFPIASILAYEIQYSSHLPQNDGSGKEEKKRIKCQEKLNKIRKKLSWSSQEKNATILNDKVSLAQGRKLKLTLCY